MTTAVDESVRKKAEDLLLANLPIIDAIVASISRRHRLSSDERDELRSQVRLRLIEEDYAVLRRHRGDSSLHTYLATVIQNLFLDGRVRAWGRYRPSIFARRNGPVAILLEKFVLRDRRTFEEACALLESRGVTIDPKAAREHYERIQSRRRPQVVHEPLNDNVVAAESGEDALMDRQRTALADGVARALRRAVVQLTPRLRLIVFLRFEQGLRVSDIARALSEDQKGLYRELDRLAIDLRASLEAGGLEASEITELLGDSRVDFGDALRQDDMESRNLVRLKRVGQAQQRGEHL